MNVKRRHRNAAVAIAILAATVLLGVPVTSEAQGTTPLEACPTCMALPTPRALDGWPDPVNDSLGNVGTASVTFSGAVLLSNDGGTSLRIVAVGPTSAGGGTVTGTDPFTFTFRPGFTGEDVFTYEVSDAAGQTAVALVRAVAVGDTFPPTVAITAPAAGATVSGIVLVTASATDNVAVAGVRFFDGATPIGPEVTAAPVQASWDTTLVAEGAHSLTAEARDLAGNVTTSAAVIVTVVRAPEPVASPTVLTTVTSNGLGTRRTAAFSTTTAGAVLLAFAASDGPAAANAQSVTMTGAGLTWTRVRRSAARFGVSEIWTAAAPGTLTNVTVTSTPSAGGFYQSLTVIAFAGSSGVGASNIASGATGAPAVSLVTQSMGSLVYAVGNDWDRAVARAISAGQTKVSEFLAPVGDTFWVQRANDPVLATGTNVTLNVTAPTTDQWNFAIVELKAGAAAPPPPPPPPPTQSGPVLQLSFNEAGGSLAHDSSGNLNDGTISGAQHDVAGQHGGALAFDGVDDWVTVPDAATLDLTGAMTIEAWVKVTSVSGWETVVLKERGVGALAYGLYAADGTTALGGADGPAGYVNIGGFDAGVRRAAALEAGRWTHVATTYDGSTERLYIDGVQVASRAQTGTIAVSGSPLRIGGNAAWAGEFFEGSIDEVRVYNRALDAAEIAADMTTPIP